MVKVLIVDDSAFMRNALRNMLSSDPHIEVVGIARDGLEAIEKVEALKPDIVTMDIEMPRMNGIEALKRIMKKTPLPVLMVSSLTEEGAKATLDALDIGAVDFIPKNLAEFAVSILKIKEVLLEKIKHLALRGRMKRLGPPAEPKKRRPIPVRVRGVQKMGVMAIGTSTGGPKALQEIIPNLPENFPLPVLVAQHMPPNFTGPFAERLDQLSRLDVKEADNGECLRPGLVLVAPGRGHMKLKRRGATAVAVDITENEQDFIYRPSVDALLLSAAEYFPGRALGVILTGMGNDGLLGAEELKKTGGKIFAQDEETCVVYGMPKAVVDAGLADMVLPLEDMVLEIVEACVKTVNSKQ